MEYILLIITTEAITELLVKSEFFRPVRQWFFEHSSNKLFKFIHSVLDCGYCTSVWVAIFVLTMSYIIWDIFLYLCLVLCIHRLSNLFHFVIDRVWGSDDKY